MLSAEIFDFIDEVARRIRNNNRPFGGIQLVIVGDFFQLSPVKGKYCFQSKAWDNAIDQNILLKTNHRQKDDVYSRICNEFRKNTLSSETLNLLEELSKKQFTKCAETNIRPTSLFCTNKNVDLMNSCELNQIESEDRIYLSDDSHQKELCDKLFTVKSSVKLKVGAQVMLLKNRGESLVNGSTGIVKEMKESSIIVEFFEVGETEIDYEVFESYDEYKDEIVTRRQLPIALSYALTMHKSQGKSIDLLEIDFKNCFTSGQAYVAISRGKSIENLYIKNFSPRVVIVDPDVVTFYDKIESGLNLRKRKFGSISKYFR